MKYPNNLGKILIEKGMKKSAFARLCEISNPYIYKIIKGDNDPSDEFKSRIKNQLNMPINRIFPKKRKKK